MDESKEVRQIPIEDIIPNRFQPRINFDEKALNELSDSIKQHGIIQPLVLRPLGDKFEIIAGERRYKAATLAGLATVPGIVTEMDDNTSAEVALIENVQRKDLSSIEEAKSYKSMLERSNMTQEELAKKMGLSQSTIANKLRLLNLSDEVQNALSQEKISERHARALLAIQDKAEQAKWLDRIIKERLTVRQLDLAIKDELSSNDDPDDGIPKVDINPDIEGIINNAVDINTNTPAPTVNNNIMSEPEETKETPRPSGKFFNYIEDEEVNMNTTEEPSSTNDISQTTQNNIPGEVFGFTPEFQNAPENNFAPSQEEEIETLDDVPTENVVEDQTPVFSVETEAPVQNEPVQEIEQTVVSEPVNTEVSVENVQEETPVSVDVNPEPVKAEIAITDQPIEEFIFDDEDEGSNEGVAVETAATEPKPVENAEDDVKIDPIPITEEEGVVDPAAFYDMLDPNFINQVKEYVGLDLKNAINQYRDLTNKLNTSGFKISIDETDLEDKYLIEININKE